MARNPLRYIRAMIHREIVYKRNKAPKQVKAETFFGAPMQLSLPAGMDIYLTGGKTHASEIRLAKFLIYALERGGVFVDVGAHYGYFTLLASEIVGEAGRVIAFEASPTNFSVLNANTTQYANIRTNNVAVSDTPDGVAFYEFPNLYSEYNSSFINAYKTNDWYSENGPTRVDIPSILLGDYLEAEAIHPAVVKIDVEGAEYTVIHGLLPYVRDHHPLIVMEYVTKSRGDASHKRAEQLLRTVGYLPHLINDRGAKEPVTNVSLYLETSGLESDNIVFAYGGESDRER